MTLQEAYIKAKMSDKEHENAYLLSCADYGDFWGFAFSPYPPGTIVGGGYDVTVNKKSGALGKYNPFIDGFDLWNKAKDVPLKLLEGLIRPVAKTTKRQKHVPRSELVPA